MSSERSLAQALAHHEARRLDEAERIYRGILAADPRHPEALRLLGLVAHQRGRAEEALDLITRAIAIRPNDRRLYNNLGLVYRALGRIAEAVAAHEKSLALGPDAPETWNNLALAQHSLGRFDDALATAQRAIALRPNYAKAWNTLGTVLASTGKFEQARAAYVTALRHNPGDAETHANLAKLLADDGLFAAAEQNYLAALRAQPRYAEAYHGLGALLGRAGRLDEAIEVFHAGLRVKPDPAHHSALLLYLQYSPNLAPREILAEHRTWARLYAEPLKSELRRHHNDRNPDRRLRVGYVSADLRSHPVAYFLEPVLMNHDRQREVEVFCYASVESPDAVTDRLRGYVDVWRDVLTQPDAQVAEIIRQDRIDVLVDLSVHLGRHRLLAFARKPAPVQLTYLGYPGTTGLETVDYKLSDPHLDPADESERFDVEPVRRLPQSYFCYRPDQAAPDVADPPLTSAGHVTFASVNTLLKVTPAVVETWSRILSAVPRSRLILQASGLNDPTIQQRLAARFAQHGVTAERLEMIGFTPVAEFLALFARLDVALDAFPYSSGTTTCHTLWMGVPVITLAGRTAVQRMGLSVLANCGLGELVARTPAEYVDLAVGMANDPQRLLTLRCGMRDRLLGSPLLDGTRQARDLERLYRDVWREWCDRPES